MRINPITGALELPEIEASLAPSLTLSGFGSLPLAELATPVRDEPPRTQFRLPAFTSGGFNFLIRVRFYEEFFMEATIESSSPSGSASWGTAEHEAWVKAAGGVPESQDWGAGSACLHPESRMSSILVRYTSWEVA